jgi:hypothetical protein
MMDIRDEYNQEIYAWYDSEADCDDWYMVLILRGG